MQGKQLRKLEAELWRVASMMIGVVIFPK